jgi:hypothetical protein
MTNDELELWEALCPKLKLYTGNFPHDEANAILGYLLYCGIGTEREAKLMFSFATAVVHIKRLEAKHKKEYPIGFNEDGDGWDD